MIQKTIRKSIIKSQHCQRNWDLTKTIPDDDIETLKSAVTECPSKQNIVFYTPYFITDRSTIEKIYENTDGFTVSYEDGTTQKNSQTLANLLVLFVKNTNFLKEKYRNEEVKIAQEHNKLEKMEKDFLLNLGVASGYLNLTSSMLGYSTGCCTCFDKKFVKNLLNLDNDPALLMGIGFKGNDNRRKHHLEEFIFPTFSKDMSVVEVK